MTWVKAAYLSKLDLNFKFEGCFQSHKNQNFTKSFFNNTNINTSQHMISNHLSLEWILFWSICKFSYVKHYIVLPLLPTPLGNNLHTDDSGQSHWAINVKPSVPISLHRQHELYLWGAINNFLFNAGLKLNDLTLCSMWCHLHRVEENK